MTLSKSPPWSLDSSALTVLDEYTRESLAIEVDTSLPALRVVRILEQLSEDRGKPGEIRGGSWS